MHLTVNQAPPGYGGSNPSLPTLCPGSSVGTPHLRGIEIEKRYAKNAHVAQLVEQLHGKE